ncbi:MAG: peptidoglycan DD-metalloendopeptidase family protein [Oligoflexia bacterium]|nr:peptidoglycan DD-metalloendopeptidase family protein [Oligoflexia bacterium]
MVLASLLVFSAQAEVLPTFQTLKDNLSKEKKLLVDSEVKKRGILGALYEINKNITKLSGDINNIETQMKNSQKTIESYAKTIVRIDGTKSTQKKLLRERLRALYKMGFKGYTEVLLSSQTSGEFARNLKFLKIVTQRDARLIQNYRATLEQLSKEQNKLRSQVKVFAQFQTQLNQEKQKISSHKDQQLFLLSQIEKDRESHLLAIKEWREAGQKLEAQLTKIGVHHNAFREIARASIFEQKGNLKPPVIREIVQKYGIMINSRFDTKIFHKGLFFAAQVGDKVSATFWGKVAFSGWINGYGETIIIDHGDHYYSLYAHNSRLDKRSGDSVATGEVIALAGDTGSLRGPGLYMEIRHFSESLDPLPWLDLRNPRRL